MPKNKKQASEYVPLVEEQLDGPHVLGCLAAIKEFRRAKAKIAEMERALKGDPRTGVVGIQERMADYLAMFPGNECRFKEGSSYYRMKLEQKDGRKTLSRDLLLAAGVPVETLDACMKEGDPYTEIRVYDSHE